MGGAFCTRTGASAPVPSDAKRLSYQHDDLELLEDASSEVTESTMRFSDRMGNLRLTGIGEEAEGNLVSSKTDKGTHMPVLDLDIPHRLIPSSTPGHSHLYLDVEMSAAQYQDLVELLVEVGVMGRGNLIQFEVRGETFARKPHVHKYAGADELGPILDGVSVRPPFWLTSAPPTWSDVLREAVF